MSRDRSPDAASRELGGAFADWLSRAHAALAAGFAAAIAGLSLRDHFRIANFDDWRLFDGLFSSPLPAWLFGNQNGHRMPVTLLLLYLDYTLLLGRMQLLVIGSLVCALLALDALGIGLGGRPALRDPVGRSLLAFAASALFCAWGIHEFLWGVNQGTVQAILWLCVALTGTALASQRRPASGAPFLVPGLAAFGATFSHGMGFAAWPAVIATALLARAPRRVILGLVAGGLVSLALYGVGVGEGGRHPLGVIAAQVIEQPGRMVAFCVSFTGAAVGRWASGLGLRGAWILQTVSLAGGLSGLALAVGLAWTIAREGGLPPRRRAQVGVGLMVFVISAGLLAALNRLPGSHLHAGVADGTSPRYATWSTLFWIGLAATWVSTRGPASKRSGVAVRVGLLLLASLVLLPALLAGRGEHRARVGLLEQWANSLRVGIEDDRIAWPLSLGEPERVYRVAARFARDRRNLFADPRADLVGARLVTRFRRADAGRCRGRMGATAVVRGRNGTFGDARGWALDTARGAPPSFIAILDAQRRVRGLAEVTEEPVRGVRGARRWEGAIADFEPAADYSAWGILADEGLACRLSGRAAGGPPSKPPSE